jgi:hypothetical protein
LICPKLVHSTSNVPVCQGAVDIAEVMFPGGSPHLVELIYKNPKLSAPFNEQLAEAAVARVRHLLPSLSPGQKVSIGITWTPR